MSRLESLARPSVRLRSGRQPDREDLVRWLVETFPTPAPVEGVAGAVAVATGAFHCLALLGDGTVMAWGTNEDGQLGDGTRLDRPAPVLVEEVKGATAIAAGAGHSLALLDDGTVVAWGSNACGVLGDGTTARRRLMPTAVRPIPARVVGISAGTEHSAALTDEGSVFVWGWHRPDHVHAPQPIAGLQERVIGITASRGHTMAVTASGLVVEWTVGDWTPTYVAGLDDVVMVTGGELSRLALRSDGTARGWGLNFAGQLADGTTTNRDEPVVSSDLPAGVVSLALASDHGAALVGDGAVWDWNGDHPPALVPGLDNGVRAMTAGRTNLALMSDGAIRWWGMRPALSDDRGDSDAVDLGVAGGASKLGGRPDLSAATTWPSTDGWPQSFLAQVNLAGVPRVQDRADAAADALPADGLLSFFYDLDGYPDGSNPSARGWSVIYTPATDELARRDFPDDLPPALRLGTTSLTAELEMTLPSVASFLPAGDALSDEESSELWTLEMSVNDDEPQHRLLGYEQPVQHGHIQARLCQLASNGVEPYGAPVDPEVTQHLEAGIGDWRLLAQFDSDNAAGMMWGDMGRIYYWIRREDLAARRFDDVWLIAQSH
ncbi:MAG: DUF1963 domain-containing protein [Actinomycetota bacterium]|nr:DUF1963 domain-containing protein [Actinomycetota bacterium]